MLGAFLSVPVAVGVLDRDLRFVAVNDALAAMNGLPRGDHLGRLGPDVLPDIDPSAWEAMRSVLATGRPGSFTVRGRTPARDDEGVWLERFEPWRDARTGEVRGVVATVFDVTEQRRAEATAERQAALLTGLAHLSAALVGIAGETDAARVLCSHAMAILGADAAMAAVARRGEAVRVVAAEGLGGGALGELARLGERSAVADTARTGVAHEFAEGPDWEAEFPDGLDVHRRAGLAATATVPLVGSEGTIGALGVSFRAPRRLSEDDHGALAAVASVGGHAMERARVADDQRRDHAVRGAFLDVLAHELKTPLATICGGLEMLSLHGADLDAAAREELLRGATEESARLARLVEDLIVVSRLERGLRPDLTEPLMLTHVSRAAARTFAASSGLEVAVSVRGEVPPVRGESAYVEQVLHNLLTNAAKYGHPPLELVVSAAPGEACARVLDSGDGLPPDRERLWELYYRDPGAARGRPGTGIGLFVCRELIALMGGRMWAADRPEGGAEFGFALPVWDEE